MDSKDHKAAGNALVQWFNSQEIAPQDALAIMAKVAAAILVRRGATRQLLLEETDRYYLQIIHDVNDQVYNVKHGK